MHDVLKCRWKNS